MELRVFQNVRNRGGDEQFLQRGMATNLILAAGRRPPGDGRRGPGAESGYLTCVPMQADPYSRPAEVLPRSRRSRLGIEIHDNRRSPQHVRQVPGTPPQAHDTALRAPDDFHRAVGVQGGEHGDLPLTHFEDLELAGRIPVADGPAQLTGRQILAGIGDPVKPPGMAGPVGRGDHSRGTGIAFPPVEDLIAGPQVGAQARFVIEEALGVRHGFVTVGDNLGEGTDHGAHARLSNAEDSGMTPDGPAISVRTGGTSRREPAR